MDIRKSPKLESEITCSSYLGFIKESIKETYLKCKNGVMYLHPDLQLTIICLLSQPFNDNKNYRFIGFQKCRFDHFQPTKIQEFYPYMYIYNFTYQGVVYGTFEA